MRAKVKTARRKASKLHGSTAGFLSIVDRGANETPFKMIKSAEGTGAMSIKKRTNVAASHKKITTGKKEAPAPVTKAVMAKLVFNQDFFENQSDVEDWIAKAEWDAESVVIEDDGEGSFIARPEGTTDESFSRIGKVATNEEGVEAFVGEMIVKDEDEEDADEADDEDADASADEGDDEEGDDAEAEALAKAKAEEEKAKKKPAMKSKRAEFLAKSAAKKVTKFDSWDAFYSKKSTLSEALEAGMKWDATPPGFYDVQCAFNGVIAGILGDEAADAAGKQAMLSKAAADYADLLGGLDTFFDAYIGSGEETVAKSFEGSDVAEKMAKWAEDFADYIATKGAQPEVATKSVVKKTAAEPAAIDYSKVADLVSKAMAPVLEQVEGVTATVTKMADRRPEKKGADLTDAGSDKKQKVEKAENPADWAREKQRKGMFG